MSSPSLPIATIYQWQSNTFFLNQRLGYEKSKCYKHELFVFSIKALKLWLLLHMI